MTSESFISTYGYLAIYIGTFLEGETILILGGFAARLGYLELPLVMLMAFLGALSGDQFFFFMGRWHGRALLKKYPRLHERATKVHQLLHRYHTYLILSFRFLYGLRMVTPLVLGSGHVKAFRFLSLNIVSAFVWAVAVTIAGYLFGQVLQTMMGDIKRYELGAMLAIVAFGILMALIHLYRRRRRNSLSPGGRGSG